MQQFIQSRSPNFFVSKFAQLKCGFTSQILSLLGIASGEIRLQSFGVTEPTTGTDTTSLKTTARKDGDNYIINGQKVWISRIEHSDLMLLLARTTDKEKTQKKTEGLSVFIIDVKKPRATGSRSGPSSR